MTPQYSHRQTEPSAAADLESGAVDSHAQTLTANGGAATTTDRDLVQQPEGTVAPADDRLQTTSRLLDAKRRARRRHMDPDNDRD